MREILINQKSGNVLWIIAQPEVASHDVLEKAYSLGMGKVIDHQTEDVDDGVEPLISMAYICETDFVEKNLLHDKDGDRLGELCAVLHDPQAKRNDFRGEEKVDNLCIIGLIDRLAACRLDEGTNHSQGGQPEVLERSRFRSRIEEWVEE